MGIFGIALRGFGKALKKIGKKKGSGPGLSDFYYKRTKDKPTILM